MKLPQPITLAPEPVTLSDGTVHTFTPLTIEDLEVTIVDQVNKQRVSVKFANIPGSLGLWHGTEYSLMGDYTQEQVDKRILQRLNKPDPKTVLEGMFVKHASKVV
jgi:hypothetical protein